MEFDEYDQRGTQTGRPVQLRVYPENGQAHVTAGAIAELFTRYGSPVDEVGYLTNTDKSVLAFDTSAEKGDTFSLSVHEGAGSLAVRGVLQKAYDVDVDELSETHGIELDVDDESGFVVADLKPVVEDATEAVHCEQCGKRCAAMSGLRNHVSRMHDGIRAAIKNGEIEADDVDLPDGDDSWKEIDEKARADGGEE